MTATAPRRVLFVDDEASVGAGLKKSLYRFRTQWTVETMTSARAALERMNVTPFDAVVSDARMPEMDGCAFLGAVQQQWPGMLRVALSGDVSRSGADELLRVAHQFIPKPVTPESLFTRIEDALEARQRLAEPSLKALVLRFGDLPSMPETFAVINRLSQQPDSSLDAFVLAVEADAAVCASVLRVVNSAWFGLSKPVSALRDAVRLLGLRPLQGVVLAAEVFGGSSPGIERLRDDALARLSVLPKLLKLIDAEALKEQAATVFVLADVGQLLLQIRMPREAVRIDAAVQAGRNRLDVERELIGADHTVLGAVLLQLWHLPPVLIDAVALHHHPRAAGSIASLSTLLSMVCALQELSRAPQPRREPLLLEIRSLATAFGLTNTERLETLFAPESAP